MLTADLVDARRKDGELLLRPLDARARAEALELAGALLDAARVLVGRRREEVEEAWAALSAADDAPSRFKLSAGLRKLAADACTFEAESAVDPAEVRRALFTRASEARRALGEGAPFDRAAIVEEIGRTLDLPSEGVERAMFSDLRAEHVLRAAPTLDAEGLVEAWELGQAQAVLLTATRVTIDVAHASPGLARAFFAKLKFHRLLFSAERSRGGWRVVIDGPYSMFDSVTKYGLELALVLPALRSLEAWSLVAELRWGKAREHLVFRLASAPRATNGSKAATPSASRAAVHLSDEVRELARGINARESGWRARPATVLLDVPGHGLCIPDLALRRGGRGDPVYVEVLGYWSRDAVFRRVALAERGLAAKIVFAVSSRLRVSAEVMDDALPASIYVYKGKMSPRAIAQHAERLVSARAAGGRSGAAARASRDRGRAG